MTDELKQLAAEHAPNFVTSAYSLGVEEVKPRLEDFGREVQRQTVEAACRAQCEWCAGKFRAGPAQLCEPSKVWIHFRPTLGEYNTTEPCKAGAIRALLSPAQEVRNG